VHANSLFAAQKGYNVGTNGNYYDTNQIPESGIRASSINGDTLRFGKVADPLGSGATKFEYQLAPSDANTSGSQRSEVEMEPNIQMNKTYWVAFDLYVQDWGTLAKGDDSVVWQIHPDPVVGMSPQLSLTTASKPLAAGNYGREFEVWILTSTASVPTMQNYTSKIFNVGAVPFGRWATYVFKFRQNTGASGLLQVWVDGKQVVDYAGPVGFNQPGGLDYAKFGYYNWTNPQTPRKLLMSSQVLVADPTGSKYTAEDLRTFVKQ
jgi:hypothetical protein